MWQALLSDIAKHSDNKLFLVLATAVTTILLNKLTPAFIVLIGKVFRFFGNYLGGRAALWSFEKQYLNWLVTDNCELKLTGVVSADDTKKPLLDQVFVSLVLDAQVRAAESPRDSKPFIPRQFFTAKEFRNLLRLQRLVDSRSGRSSNSQLDLLARKLPRPWFRSRNSISLNLPKWIGALGEWNIELENWIREAEEYISQAIEESQLRYILGSYSRIAILGAPGAGKTTLLQFVALLLARHGAGDKHLRIKSRRYRGEVCETWKVPVFLRLASLSTILMDERRKGTDPTIIELLPRLLPPHLQKSSIASKYFQRQLKSNRLLFLLDGLDEVATDEEFRQVTRLLESALLEHSDCQFVITSRVAGWRGGIRGNLAVFHVQELNATQIDRFVRTWYLAVEQNSVVGRLKDEGEFARKARENRATLKAESLLQTLRENVGVRRIAGSPMLLSIIALVHRSRVTLPRERGKLYSECAEILAELWDISRGIRVDDTMLTLDQKLQIMTQVAYSLHSGAIGDEGGGRETDRSRVLGILRHLLPALGREEKDAERLLKVLIERSGLLIERRRDILSFSHHTFQEYFAALYIFQSDNPEPRALLLRPERLLTDWWREVVLLYSGLLRDASSFLKLVRGDSKVDDFLQSRLRLAGMCAVEAIQISKPEVRADIIQGIVRIKEQGRELTEDFSRRIEVADYLVRWSKGPEWLIAVAESVSEELTGLQLEKAAAAFETVLNDPSGEFKWAALEGLKRLALRTTALRTNVEKLLSHENSSLAFSAARFVLEATGRVESASVLERAAEVIGKQLQNIEGATGVSGSAYSEPFLSLSKAAAAALARLGDEQDVERGALTWLQQLASRFQIGQRASDRDSDESPGERLLSVVQRHFLKVLGDVTRPKAAPSLETLTVRHSRRIAKSKWGSVSLTRVNPEWVSDTFASEVSRAGEADSADRLKDVARFCVEKILQGTTSESRSAIHVASELIVIQQDENDLSAFLQEVISPLRERGHASLKRALESLDCGFRVSSENALAFWRECRSSEKVILRRLALRSLAREDFPVQLVDLRKEFSHLFMDKDLAMRVAAMNVLARRGLNELTEDAAWMIENGLNDRRREVRLAALRASVCNWPLVSQAGGAELAGEKSLELLAWNARRATSWLGVLSSRDWSDLEAVLKCIGFIGRRHNPGQLLAQMIAALLTAFTDAGTLFGTREASWAFAAVEEISQGLSKKEALDHCIRLLRRSLFETKAGLVLMRTRADVIRLVDVREELTRILATAPTELRQFSISTVAASAGGSQGDDRSALMELLLRALGDESTEIRLEAWLGLSECGMLVPHQAQPYSGDLTE